MIKRKFSILSMTVVLTGLLVSCGEQEAPSIKEPTIRPVKMQVIEKAESQRTLSFPAVVGAATNSELSFQVGGLIQELSVRESQQVEKGDVIAKLNPRDFQNKVNSAKSQFDNAVAEHDRSLNLFEKGSISKSEVEQLKSQRDVTEAQYDSAKKALNDTVLRAPTAGVIASVPVKRLQAIQAGGLVVTLISGATMEATINLPARVIATSTSRVDKGSFVVLEAAPEKRISAQFKEALLEADSVSQTYEVKFTFDPPESLTILPGMNATVLLTSTAKSETENSNVDVPLSAVMSEGEQKYLWIVDTETMKVSKRNVSIKEGIGETVIVTKGLAPGDTIVSAGASYLAEGMQVRSWSN